MIRKTVIVGLCIFIFQMFLSPGIAAASAWDSSCVMWKRVLDQYEEDGLINYQVLKENPNDLNIFLKSVEGANRNEYNRWSRNQKIAFWINVYNALAMKMVADHYPIKKGLNFKALVFPENSIQQIPNVWNQKALEVFGEKISLNMIENEILRKEFNEPRIHFALVCASIGCPVLRGEPYTAERLDDQFNDQIHQFLSNPEKFRYDNSRDTMHLSPIFKWFRKDFNWAGGIPAFVRQYLPEKTADRISGKTKIEWLGYDWSLNERGDAREQ